MKKLKKLCEQFITIMFVLALPVWLFALVYWGWTVHWLLGVFATVYIGALVIVMAGAVYSTWEMNKQFKELQEELDNDDNH